MSTLSTTPVPRRAEPLATPAALPAAVPAAATFDATTPVTGVAAAPPAPPRPKKKPKPHLVARGVSAVVVLAVIAAVSLWLRPAPTTVDIAVATTGPLRVTVDADAVTRVRNHFVVAAPVAGLVERIVLREGDAVRAGEVIATIATPPVHATERRAALARLDAAHAGALQADARLGAARLALDQAGRDDRRAHALLDAGAIADRDAELAALTLANRRADLSTAAAQRQFALAELAQARAAADATAPAANATTLVRAPAPGRVLGIPERSARVVAAGAPLIELGDPASLEIAADVLSSDAASVRAGQEVELRGWGGAPFRGVVRRVEPSARTRISALGVEEQRLTVVIDLPSAPSALGDGYRLDAGIVVWEGRDVLTVPAGALLRSDGGWELFRLREGRTTRMRVSVGHVGSGVAEVTSGLRRGDSVVVFPPDALREGTRVRGAG
jgi:HlyD family secretion protein